MVVTGGRNGRRHGDGRRRQAAATTMHARLFQRREIMMLWEIMMWREVWVSFVKLS